MEPIVKSYVNFMSKVWGRKISLIMIKEDSTLKVKMSKKSRNYHNKSKHSSQRSHQIITQVHLIWNNMKSSL